MKFFIDKKIIPINCKYKISYKPYYLNMSYLYRDFYTDAGFTELLNKKYTNKEVSYKSYNIGKYYIPNIDKGEFIKNENIPKIVKMYNIIHDRFYIKELYTFNKNSNISVYRYLNLKFGRINEEFKKKIRIKFMVDSVTKCKNINYIRWVPLNEFFIESTSYFEIDISEFVSDYDLKIYKNSIMILCNRI